MISITAFRWVPPLVQGLVRDLRPRWALEEAGIAYRERLVDFEEAKQPAYRALQPFGQVPVYVDDSEPLTLFESGAILLHIGAQSPALLPLEPAGRARATMWLLAALNTIEPAIQQLAEIDLFYPGADWTTERRPQVEERIRLRLGELAEALGENDYLEGRFSVGDLAMTTVLRILRHTDLVAEQPRLRDYVSRCEARPTFQRALADHLAPFGDAPSAPNPLPQPAD